MCLLLHTPSRITGADGYYTQNERRVNRRGRSSKVGLLPLYVTWLGADFLPVDHTVRF